MAEISSPDILEKYTNSMVYFPERFDYVQGGLTTKAKAEFANLFIDLVESNFSSSLFGNKFYKIIIKLRGHRKCNGFRQFYKLWFLSPESRVTFLKRWAYKPIKSNDPNADLYTALREYIIYEERITQQQILTRQEMAYAKKPKSITGATVPFKVLMVAEANTFNKNQYVMVSQDNHFYQVSTEELWSICQIVHVPLGYDGIDWMKLGVFSASRIFPTELNHHNIWAQPN